MLSRKQYLRLTLVLFVPFLLLGLWLVESEKIFPIHSLIYCQENDSEIVCDSMSATKAEVTEALYQNAAVRLWGAQLQGGLNHSVVTVGHPQIKVVNGRAVTIPTTNVEVRKHLSLPPKPKQGNVSASCEISPYASSDKDWVYLCVGGDAISERFYFASEKVSQKFTAAKILIGEKRKENDGSRVRGVLFTTLLPLIAYFFLSVVLLLLNKVVRYVIYGRAK